MDEVFTAREDRGDGLDLRALRYGGEVVLARLYFAMRDIWWQTIPLTVVRRHHARTPAGFVLDVDAVAGWESHPMDVTLRYAATGPELTAELTAAARAPFAYGRIGFCLLFGMDAFRGRPGTSWRSGQPTAFEFPDRINTRDHVDADSLRFHRPFDRLETPLPTGTVVRYEFEGEEFEFEDQRNWTDASFKAYSSPLVRGLPSATVAGRTFRQRVRITAGSPGGIGVTSHDGSDDRIRLGDPVAVVPPIGLYRGRLSPRSFRPAGGFHELNARGLDPARLARNDSIELGLNGSVHAADDDSVLESTALHGVLVAQARAGYPGLPVRLAPVTFQDVPGDWRDGAGRYLPEPPPGPLPERLLRPFAATWAIASAARALPEGPDALAYFDSALPPDTPAARAVARLAGLAGRPVLAVRAAGPLAVLAVAPADTADGATVTLAVANPGPDPVRFRLPDGRAATLSGFVSEWFDVRPAQELRVTSRESAAS